MRLAVRTEGQLSTTDQASVAALWFAFFAQWIILPAIVVPSQVAQILGETSPDRAVATGLIVAGGAIVSLVITPIAGALSDRASGPRGRRWPFLVSGIVGSSLALPLLTWLGQRHDLVLYGLAYLNLQIWWNWAAGPYAGLIPDVVPAGQQGAASGWMNAMSILGVVVGNALAALVYEPGAPMRLVAILVTCNLACLAAVILRVPEPPADGGREPGGIRALLRGFWLPPQAHPNFYWVLLTRLLSNMGIWSVLTFLLFYIQAVLGLDPAAAKTLLAGMLGIGALLSVPASLIGVRLAERHGLVRMVRIASWIMAGATLAYVLIALKPVLWLAVPVIVIFSIANGAYGALDWYLALRVMPRREHVGKDMGIWHVCMVLPQIVGPVTTGWLITEVARSASDRLAYGLAFAIAAIWFAIAASLVRNVRLDPDRASPASPPG